jgi:ADP-dependent NAD(P)H-hydrate dehydratase
MPGQIAELTPRMLRDWPLPQPHGSKYDRGSVLVVGGSARTPGAAQLSGLAALRVGAGHLTLAVAGSAAVSLAVATPEAGVIGLPENDHGSVISAHVDMLDEELASADTVLVGPGLDDADETGQLIERLVPKLGPKVWLVLDAYALAPLPDLVEAIQPVRGRLVLTPNGREGGRLLGREVSSEDDIAAMAARYSAVVTCQGIVCDPHGSCWRIGAGDVGLATSGSGDVLAGTVAGLVARCADGTQATCWATYAHAAAGDRLAARVGRLGFLAREILDELPAVMVELDT